MKEKKTKNRRIFKYFLMNKIKLSFNVKKIFFKDP